MSDNRSFVLNGVLDTTFVQRPIPELAPDEVLVEVKKTGICGSDVHYYVEGRMGANVVTQPFVIGHESSGVIAKVGANVKNVSIGDRVAIEPGATCRVCDECKSGRYQLCEHMIFPADHPHDGTLGRYYKFPADHAYKLPDHLTLEDGAMLEPLSVAVHVVATRANLRAGQSVAVFGAGPVGLLCMAVARALGAQRVIAIDIVPARLEFARGYAAAEVFLAPHKTDESTMDYSRKTVEIMKKTLDVEERGSKSIDLTIDATGAETCIQMAILIAKIEGSFIQVGFGALEAKIPVAHLITKELTMKGSIVYGPGDYRLALALASLGRVDLRPLVTHRFAFEDAISAFETARSGRGLAGTGQIVNAIKVIISGPGVNPAAL